jgi:hypothetical protein
LICLVNDDNCVQLFFFFFQSDKNCKRGIHLNPWNSAIEKSTFP